jgi:uncharacterized protein (TIRG00374 family)
MTNSASTEVSDINTEIIDSPEGEQTFSYSRIIRSVLIFSLAGIALYGAVTIASGYQSIISALARFPAESLVQVIALVVVGWTLRGVRFHYYLQKNGESVPMLYSISSFLAGFALTGTPGKIGEAMKGVFLKRDYCVRVTKVVGILVVERLMDLFGVLLLGSVSLLLFEGWIGLFLACSVLVIGAGVFLCMEGIYRPALTWLARFRVMAWPAKRVLAALLSGKELMTARIFFIGLVLSFLAWSMEAVSLYIIMKGFGLSATLLEANFIYSFSTLVGALSMAPGGIGGTEAGMIGLMAFMGITYSEGLPAVLLIRICTLWLAIFVGFLFSIYLTAVPKTKHS